MTSGFYSRPLLLAISTNPVKAFTIQVLHKVEQVVVFIAARGTLNFPLWISVVLVLELELSSVATR